MMEEAFLHDDQDEDGGKQHFSTASLARHTTMASRKYMVKNSFPPSLITIHQGPGAPAASPAVPTASRPIPVADGAAAGGAPAVAPTHAEGEAGAPLDLKTVLEQARQSAMDQKQAQQTAGLKNAGLSAALVIDTYSKG